MIKAVSSDQHELTISTERHLPQQHAHVFAGGKGRGHERRELAAVGHLPDVHLIDNVVDLLAGANYPNLRSLLKRLRQPFVELCRHDISPLFRV
jgi:hypothetical protein